LDEAGESMDNKQHLFLSPINNNKTACPKTTPFGQAETKFLESIKTGFAESKI
jgi:hypothetical protein